MSACLRRTGINIIHRASCVPDRGSHVPRRLCGNKPEEECALACTGASAGTYRRTEVEGNIITILFHRGKADNAQTAALDHIHLINHSIAIVVKRADYRSELTRTRTNAWYVCD